MNKLQEKSVKLYKEIKFDRRYRNLKTGKTYFVYGDIVRDCTNIRDGVKAVLYTDGASLFVREIVEFMQKFKLVENK